MAPPGAAYASYLEGRAQAPEQGDYSAPGTLQEWMGHRDIQTTMCYADYAPSTQEAELIAAAFDQTVAGLPGGDTEDVVGPQT